MLDTKMARERAQTVAQKYFGDCQNLSVDELIGKIENKGYALARRGKATEAAFLFVAVSDLELARKRDRH